MAKEEGRHGFKVITTILVVVVFVLALVLFISKATGVTNPFASKNDIASEAGRTNILIMGKAGSTYAGPDLTDTMILASISLTKPSIVLISIPRDLWIPEIRAKINSAYYWGNQPGGVGGIKLAASTAANVLGVPVHYGMVLDFSAFKDIINELDGITVNVERGFTDSLYPIEGKENDTCGGDPLYKCRYETIAFSAGLQKMDGNTALKFIRSRHAEGMEGTDIAREARQQKVISAIKNKILTPQVFLNPAMDARLWNVAKKSIQSDLNGNAGLVLIKSLLESRNSITQNLIPADLLVNPSISKIYDKQYVFIPKAGNGKWKDINAWVRLVLN